MSVTFHIKSTEKELSQRKLETYDRYQRVINWGRQYPVEFASRIMGIELLDMQKYALYNSWTAEFILWLMCRNAGKCLAIDTPIPTPNGTKLLKDIQVGDYVFGGDGKPTRVTYCSEVFNDKPCYDIRFSDGERLIASGDHLWNISINDGYKRRCAIMTTEDMVESYKYRTINGALRYTYSVPCSEPLQYQTSRLAEDPYVMGLVIGGGRRDTPTYVKLSQSNYDEVMFKLRERGYTASYRKYAQDIYLYIGRKESASRKTINSVFKYYGMDKGWFIPKPYLEGSIQQRRDLLMGLMDATSYTYGAKHRTFIKVRGEYLAKDAVKLLNSLGYKTRVACKGRCYYIYFRYDGVSKFTAKEANEKLSAKRGIDYKTIISIRRINSVPTKCISVDNLTMTYVCGRHCTVTHNTTDIAIYTMLRSILLPFHVTYFLGNTGEQSKEVFSKIEKIAKRNIESFTGCTDVFINELVKEGSNSTGFIHNPASFSARLFNGSEIYTLNSDPVNIKGKRANLVCFDESGWFSDELFIQAENFVNQSEDFKLGKNVRIDLEPPGFPRQLLYASSASDTSSGFYRKLRNFSEQMIMGDRRYFACNFDVDLVMKAKYNGEPYPPLLSQDKVDALMNSNREKGLRELYNKFTADTHEGQIITRRDLLQHTKNVPPVLSNPDGKSQYILAWDSARLNDNSTIVVGQVWDDPKRGWVGKIVNVINLVDVKSKNKTPMIMPEQVEEFKKILLRYNGTDHRCADYENILAVVCDSGAGGQMVGGVSDYLLADWQDSDGMTHKGLIDRSHKANETAAGRFPNAVDIMKLVDPRSHRNEIFDAAERMTKLGVIEFPAEWEDRDYIVNIDNEGNEDIYDLTDDEKLSLAQISRMKDELVLVCKYVNKGQVSYAYPPDKRNTEHDDRAFAYGLFCWYLSSLRRGQLREPVRQNNDVKELFGCFRAPRVK
jgi:hypothetical protein